jgi:hypothetical protein
LPIEAPKVDPDLLDVVNAWSDLPADVQKMIVSVVRLTSKRT